MYAGRKQYTVSSTVPNASDVTALARLLLLSHTLQQPNTQTRAVPHATQLLYAIRKHCQSGSARSAAAPPQPAAENARQAETKQHSHTAQGPSYPDSRRFHACGTRRRPPRPRAAHAPAPPMACATSRSRARQPRAPAPSSEAGGGRCARRRCAGAAPLTVAALAREDSAVLYRMCIIVRCAQGRAIIYCTGKVRVNE